MRVWKQLAFGAAILLAGSAVVVRFVPGADATLAGIGIPQSMIDAVAGPAAAGGGAEQAGGGQGRGGPVAPLVVLSSAQTAVVNDRLNAIGSGEAIQSVVVMPQSTGTIDVIHIKSGDHVAKGQVLARLDDDEQIIARDQAQVALKSALEKSQLYQNIKSTVSRMDVFDAEIAEESARLELQTAEFNLKRRDIVAPIDGIVGIVAVNIGDNVTTQTDVVTIDDRSEILVDFWAPERFTNQIVPGMPIEATAVARPGEVYTGVVESVDNRIDPASRTLRIRARIPNENDELRAGMSFSVSVKFSGESFPAVDPLSVQWDAVGSYVWRIKDGKAEKVRVRIIQRNPDAVLVKADIAEGDHIVTEGLLRLRDGLVVRTAGHPETAPHEPAGTTS
ncbi:efflux RND transporter periplasmic adaptor subunit [Rhizobiaceae bacterium n13]|uniref:Efflux RND transporter periplasmic adaptor subunit n=1 Tax=Ferirhizobium litorale TaxID=2927786 RepID=A0AAE3QID0_9HYPH|nr:efflux RND transporter periplasmic adaptor subunit [Fererhizobium litorale]MDI7863820.1 efflux RND transporter periplasmic adaptor subunit [Fererhizobium litorale]MDI7924080.1 efflux RND transporter periplasmic adaptor subunit [Fererhizobium litorale]